MLTNEKNQAPTIPALKLVRLGIEDLDAVYSLECAAFPKPMQASRETIATRFELGHFMLGAFKSNSLVGITAWRYGHFDPAQAMPLSFHLFANRPNTASYNAAFVYNFAIDPALRNTKTGLELSTALISEGIKTLISNECSYLVGASRCPSYAGSDESFNRCIPSIELRKAIDREERDEPIDSKLPWQNDPVLSFYKHTLSCIFHQVLPAFMPEDEASGGYAIGFYKTLNRAT